MNRLIYAGENIPDALLLKKPLKVFFKDGKVIVIPPAVDKNYGGLCVAFEQPVSLSFKSEIEICGEAYEQIKEAAERAKKIFAEQGGKNSLVLTALGDLICAYLADAREKTLHPAVTLILEDLDKNLSVCTYSAEDALKKLPLNYDYLRKLFKKQVGTTPREYLLDRRMKLAAQLILGGADNRYSEYTVSQLAEACGYTEPLYFSRVFKQYFGVSPNAYGKK